MSNHSTQHSTESSSDPDYGIRAPAYRLPSDARPGRVRLQVADLGRSLEYYQSIMGFSLLGQAASTATLGTAGDDTAIIELVERVGANPVPPRGRLGLFHYAILLPDRASLGRFIAHLASKRVNAGSSDHLVSEALYLSDPDGLGIEVYSDRPRSAWQAQDRQLVMSTLPLDIDDLLRASGGTPWTGMPVGTRIGHMHLHVGDIEQAALFYHDALGLDKMVWSYPRALFLSAGGYHHHLGVNTWAGKDAARPSPDDSQLLEWELLLGSLPDVNTALDALADAGNPVERTADGGVAHDPWGTALRLRTRPRG